MSDSFAGGVLAVAAPVAIAISAAGGALTPGYDSSSDTVSLLASPGQPWAAVLRATFVFYGLLLVWAAPTVASWSTGLRLQRWALQIGGVAVAMTGLAAKDMPGAPHTLQSSVHVQAAVSAGLALTLAMAASLVRQPRRRLGLVTAACIAATTVASALFPFAWGTDHYGVLERLALLGPLVWLTCVGWLSTQLELRMNASMVASGKWELPDAPRGDLL